MKMMAENLDWPVWINIFRRLSPDTEFKVMVPIIPTIAVFTEVHLITQMIGDKVSCNSAEVNLVVPDHSARKGINFETIGIMSAGDGLSALRWMLFDWFRGNIMPTGKFKCRSTLHGFGAQSRWKKDMVHDNTALGQYYTVWTTGKCMACQGGFEDNNFDPDLVPDPGSGRSPWR
jgi:hypothetical protein